MDASKLISKTFSFKVGEMDIEPTYWQAAAIVLLLFLLVWTIARVRYLYVHWNLGKSAIAMFAWGFALALIVEGFLLIGGRTLFTEVLGWRNAPKPVSTALDLSREKLITTLGVTDEIPMSKAEELPTYQSVVGDFLSLPDEDQETVKSFICEP